MSKHETSAAPEALPEIPVATIPRAPLASVLWSRTLVITWVGMILFLLDRLTLLLSDFWLLQSLGLESVFWTNFGMGAWLFALGFSTAAFGIASPAYFLRTSRGVKRVAVSIGLLVGVYSGYLLSMEYSNFLLSGAHGVKFGKTDPYFGSEYSFYLFDLPNIMTAWGYLIMGSVWGLISAIACSYAATREGPLSGRFLTRLGGLVARVSTRATCSALAVFGGLLAVGIFLGRYELLYKDNKASSIKVGPAYLDVQGFFSNLNYIYLTTVLIIGATVAAVLMLRRLHAAPAGTSVWGPQSRRLGLAVLLLLALDFAFRLAVEIRGITAVGPNEPVIQLDYIARHIDATREAYKLENIQEVSFTPKGPGDPLPDARKILASAAAKNLPLWPGYTAYLEDYLDRQHSERVLQTRGDIMVYGPTLEIMRQQQKLRTYYDFTQIDNVRYRIGDETRMFVSSVRELPLWEPSPWLAYWGTRFMLYTHGYGLVMAPASGVTPDGGPLYVSKEIPPQAAYPEIALRNQSVYYGEGAATVCFSNVKNMKELDYPTEQDRAELWLPADVKTGVKIDSFLKRLVFGWRSGKLFDLVFSGLITDETRIHFNRTPVERLERVAPFLYYDSNPYAVVVDGQLTWMVNGMTTSNSYPYSLHEEMGDKSDERSRRPRPERMVNYIEDSVKATVDAYTGAVRFYKISNDPVIEVWSRIYPDLFVEGATMPPGVRAQMTYPPQLFHIQFDDLYIYYHMKDPMYYFNMEDMWDDADEVLGPMLDEGRAVTFSFEPYNCMLDVGGALPESDRPAQYALVMPFTPERALNLRAIPVVYQDGEDYGKITVLAVPKGHYVIGPEQADASVDQVPEISQQFAWWNRRGMEVIRGHTTLVIHQDEVIYVEPIFLRSRQNPISQLKKVVVTFRGTARMADTFEQALEAAMEASKNGAAAPP
jgi:uncharacterized membrane protein (UPF0182 family)